MIRPGDKVRFKDRVDDGHWVVVDVTGDGDIVLRREPDKRGKQLISATGEQLRLWP